ncbi:uncharacterized protein ACB058_003576 [Synchiropus picturatus]
MSHTALDKSPNVSKVWIALKHLDKDDDRVVALREVAVPPDVHFSQVAQIIVSTFALDSHNIVLKLRNQRGCLIPLNGSIPANSKRMPHLLEVVRIFQHVRPIPKTIPMTVINKSMKARLQSIDRRLERLEGLLPQIKVRHNEKLSQDIECLDQKLKFLHQRMQVVDSHSWKGMLTRAPLW